MIAGSKHIDNPRYSKHEKATFPILEMTCAACAVSVESMLKSVVGVHAAAVNYANQNALVEYDANVTNPKALREAVKSIGYDLVADVDSPASIQEEARLRHYSAIRNRFIWSAILTLPVVIFGMFLMDIPYANYISMALSAPVVFWFGRSYFINAWKQAIHGMANMDTLVALSTGIAFCFSAFNTLFPEFWHARDIHPPIYFESASVVIVFISLGKFLEEKAKAKTSSALRNLMGMQPTEVVIIVEDKALKVSIAEVKSGQLIQVHPGERIPVDGIVKYGSSYVEESMITGEPIPVAKREGSKVFAGTVNQKGSFQFVASNVGDHTLLSQIIKRVEHAQGSKAPVRKLVDKVTTIFVPAVLLIAILTFVVWISVGGENAFSHGLLTSITVMVIACPCALGLATPTALMVGVGKGAENNILIKDAASLEIAHKVDVVVLDKTGTITEGKPAVTDMIFTSMLGETYHLSNILYSIESLSEHPLAGAVATELIAKGAKRVEVKHFNSITGSGVTAIHNGTSYYVGSRRLLTDNNINVPSDLQTAAESLQAMAKSVIFFADQNDALGLVAITDKIKSSAGLTIQTLNNSGIKVIMLTGDNRQTAQAVANAVGIDSFRSEMLPEAKADFIRELQGQGYTVGMVGDGINDGEALAQADLSIALGEGTDIAMDVAGMTLTSSDLQSIPKALKLSRATVIGIRQNLFWAFIYNVIGIPLAAGVLYPVNGFLLNPMIAGAAMALSSVSVVANSLRLRSMKI